MVNIDDGGKVLTHNRETDILDFPGGGVKFTIRYDTQSGMYWALVCKQKNPDAYRNNLVLVSSEDLINWQINYSVLHHPDMKTHAFQYVDWQFEGDDIVFVSRTSYADGLGGAHDAHDAHDYELKNAVIVAAIIFSVVLLVGLVGVLQLHI